MTGKPHGRDKDNVLGRNDIAGKKKVKQSNHDDGSVVQRTFVSGSGSVGANAETMDKQQ